MHYVQREQRGNAQWRLQAHVTAQTLLYAVANASPKLHTALLRTVVPTLEALWGRAQVRPPHLKLTRRAFTCFRLSCEVPARSSLQCLS